MNQHLDPKGNRPGDPVNWPAEPATTQRVDPLAAQQPRNEYTNTTIETRRGFSGWPVLIVLLAGLVLALLVWLPSGTTDTSDTATQPATTEQTTTPPAGDTATPDTAVTPTPEATPAVPDTQQQTPATGETQPQTEGATPNTNTNTNTTP